MNMLAWNPLTDRLIVRPFSLTTRQKGQRIVRPDQIHERPHLGKVVSIGPGVNPSIKVDDIVAFGKFAGVELMVEARKLLVMRDTEVFLRQAGSDLELTTHEIKGADDVVVDELIHEAHSYCAECDPLSADNANTTAPKEKPEPLIKES